MEYYTCLYTVFYEFKAFLDLYARFMCKVIDPDHPPVNGFGRAAVGGEKLSGGKFANRIGQQREEQFPNRDLLRELVVSASRDWISAAVDHRDTLAHFRDLPGAKHIRVSLTKGPAAITESDILAPEMPDGSLLVTYVDDLRHRLGVFVDRTVRTLPRVNMKLIETWNDASRRLH